jgi:hypothetical protein
VTIKINCPNAYQSCHFSTRSSVLTTHTIIEEICSLWNSCWLYFRQNQSMSQPEDSVEAPYVTMHETVFATFPGLNGTNSPGFFAKCRPSLNGSQTPPAHLETGPPDRCSLGDYHPRLHYLVHRTRHDHQLFVFQTVVLIYFTPSLRCSKAVS